VKKGLILALALEIDKKYDRERRPAYGIPYRRRPL
jgi:hypothetical protein